MTTLPDALQPFAPFANPVAPPIPGPLDAPLVHFCCNETWMTYLVGAAQCLMSAVTWNSDDENVVQTTISNARVLISAMMNLDECPVAIQFRPDPAYPQNFQYSLDA